MISINDLEHMSIDRLETVAGIDDPSRRTAILIAQAFFDMRDDVLQVPGDDPVQDRYRAMLMLLALSSQYKKRYLPLHESDVSRGFLQFPCKKFSEVIHEGYCYDGGCYSDESEERHYRSFTEIKALSPRSPELAELAVQGDLAPGVFPRGNGVYIVHDSLGLRGSFRLSFYTEACDERS